MSYTCTVAVAEQVSRADYQRTIEEPIAEWFGRTRAHDRILDIVLTKGMPLRIAGTAGRDGTMASVDLGASRARRIAGCAGIRTPHARADTLTRIYAGQTRSRPRSNGSIMAFTTLYTRHAPGRPSPPCTTCLVGYSSIVSAAPACRSASNRVWMKRRRRSIPSGTCGCGNAADRLSVARPWRACRPRDDAPACRRRTQRSWVTTRGD